MDESRLVSLILQACIQQTYKGRNGGNSDTFSGGVRGEYIHTGGDHRHIRCKLMEYRWLQSHMNDIFTELLNFDNDQVLDVPLLYVKDMIVFNSDKIANYTFTSTPMFFDVRQIQPAE